MKQVFALLFALFIAVGSVAPAFAQEAKPAAGAATEVTEVKKTHDQMTAWDHIVGGGPVMFIIAICSVATIYLIVDGLMRITNYKKTIPEEHTSALKSLFRAGDYVGSAKFCKNNPSPLTNVVRSGLVMAGEGKHAAEESMFAEVSKENAQMQYFISYLSVIGVCTPMIGLLGTVFGMISAFATLGTSGIGDPSKLSAAIGEVLMATASGLLIAIPAFFSFYWLRNRAAKITHRLQETAGMLFRKMPYDLLAGAHLGDDELYAATPNWVQVSGGEQQHLPAT